LTIQNKEKDVDAMAQVTPEDLKKVSEPCKSCELSVSGKGKNRTVYCERLSAKLMGGGDHNWFQLMDCPKIKKT
jgi:uncharacterized protein